MPVVQVGDIRSLLPPDVLNIIDNLPLIKTIDEMPEHMRANAQAFGGLLENPRWSTVQRQIALSLLAGYSDIFGKSKNKVNQTTVYQAEINLVDGALPVKFAPYRVGPKQKEIVDREVKAMLEADVIRPSRSPWGARVLLVNKKDGSTRFCVDYRALNDLTKTEVYPLPRIDDTLACFEGKTVFSTMDMQSGYWQVPVAEKDKSKTAFITHQGLFEFNVMPFGPKNAPGYFQRMMDEVLADIKWISVIVYIDDLIVFSRNFADHITDLTRVFERLRDHELTLKLSKCHFFQEKVEYLGHVVSKDGIAPNPDKIKAVAEAKPPTSVKAVQSFLGLTGYYRKFIQGYAALARPLHDMCKKGVTMDAWGSSQDESFQKLKQALTEAPILVHPRWEEPFKLD
jgi:hypothetical protein